MRLDALSRSLTEAQVPHLRRALLEWYWSNRRDLPWRQTLDPYCIWLSEIMLQQTRVAVVVDRYRRFLKRFPSVQQLARARLTSVLAEWSGLGYYHRARNLHATARLVSRLGDFPGSSKELQELPGIGRYTASAIASIVFAEPVAVLDGNVERVLSRLSGRSLTKQQLWQLAGLLLESAHPGDFNQAMMELGATVCVPGQPNCRACPLHRFCATRSRGTQKAAPALRKKRQITRCLAHRNGAVLLIRRPTSDSLMPGMWELPETPARASDQPLFTVRHSITVTDYSVHVVSRRPSLSGGKWVEVSQIQRLPLTGLTKKILIRASLI